MSWLKRQSDDDNNNNNNNNNSDNTEWSKRVLITVIVISPIVKIVAMTIINIDAVEFMYKFQQKQ